jgi:hypothetical protein
MLLPLLLNLEDVGSLAPGFTSISPESGVQGDTVPVVLVGTNFDQPFGAGDAAINVSGAGITVDNVVIVDPEHIEADFIIALGADLGAHDVTVETDEGESTIKTFTVTSLVDLTPTITSIAPVSGRRSTSKLVNIYGTNFVNGDTIVAVTGGGITITELTYFDSTRVRVRFTIDAAADMTARDVTVETSEGESNTATFTVTAAAGSGGGGGKKAPLDILAIIRRFEG